MANFSDRIRQLRTDKGLTQAELSKIFNKSDSATRMWELGRSKPDADTLIELSKFFECTTDYLLGLNNFKSYSKQEEISQELKDLSEHILVFPQEVIDGILESLNAILSCYRLIRDDNFLTDSYLDFLKMSIINPTTAIRLSIAYKSDAPDKALFSSKQEFDEYIYFIKHGTQYAFDEFFYHVFTLAEIKKIQTKGIWPTFDQMSGKNETASDTVKRKDD